MTYENAEKATDYVRCSATPGARNSRKANGSD